MERVLLLLGNRFAIANVSDGIIKQIPDRLSQLNQLYGDKAESAAL
jgi:hypothetical protein